MKARIAKGSNKVENLSFEHPAVKDSGDTYEGLNGVFLKDFRQEVGLTLLGGGEVTEVELALIVINDDGAFEIRFYSVEDGEATEVNEAIPLDALEDENVFAGFTISDEAFFDYFEGQDVVVIAGGESCIVHGVKAPLRGLFLRGDCDEDGDVDPLFDTLFLLTYGFADGPAPDCLDTLDVDGDDVAQPLFDALYMLEWGFVNGPPPPEPLESCGADFAILIAVAAKEESS